MKRLIRIRQCTKVVLMLLFLSNEVTAQVLCDPPIPVSAGTDVTIPCGGNAVIGQVPPPSEETPVAPSCTTPGQLTQGGGVYIHNVSTTGGINGNDISNLGTLVGGIDPMGPNAWQSVWYSNYTAHLVESTPGGTFYLTVSGRSLYSNPPYSFRIWIDWNNDGVFDNTPGGELVHTTALTTINPVAFNNIPVNVPPGQQPGVFRMRIRAKDNSPFVPSDNACTYNNAQGIIAPHAGYTGNQTGTYWFSSEVEDYSVKISGPNTGGSYTYSWTPPENLDNPSIPDPTATPPSTTTYTVTVTDTENNCISTGQITVTVTTVTPTFTNPGPVCTGTNFTLPASSDEGITGTWSPAIINTATTTYTFTPDEGQCADLTEMTVVVNPEVTPLFTNPGPLCSGTSFALPGISDNGISGTWTPAVNTMETTTYTFTPESQECASSGTLTVVIDDQLIPEFTNPGPVCPGTSFSLPGISDNGISGTWSPAVNNNTTTTYTFTPANAGCVSDITLTVVVDNQVVPVFTNPGPVCSGSSFMLPSTSVNGITGTWSPVVNNETTTTYTFTPDDTGCASSTTLTVVVNDPLTPVFANPGPVCPGTSFILPVTSDNGVTGTWTPAVNTTATTTYTFTPDHTECAFSATMTVVVNPDFEITLSGGGTVCQGEELPSVTLTAVGGTAPYTFTYAIDNGVPVSITSGQTSITMNSSEYPGFDGTSGCYDLIVGGSAGTSCLTGTTVFTDYLCIYPKPDASFIVSGGSGGIYSMTNTSSGATGYEWNFGDHSQNDYSENPTHKFPDENPANYRIELIAYSNEGCSDTTYRIITIEEELIFYVPNTFTPDGDEYNNVFKPVMTSGYDPFNYRLEIYNRWGECIFTSDNTTTGWDGTYNGKMAQDGLYTWKVALKTKYNDDKKIYVGHVNIIR